MTTNKNNTINEIVIVMKTGGYYNHVTEIEGKPVSGYTDDELKVLFTRYLNAVNNDYIDADRFIDIRFINERSHLQQKSLIAADCVASIEFVSTLS
jgi:hypothetical protein